jgi:putative transposase
MGQSLVQIYVHIVFSTKNRQPFLRDNGFCERLHGYLAGTAQNLSCPPLKVGGVEDHVHLHCRLGKQIDISKLIAELKRESSKWIKHEQPNLAGFYWQNGYGAFLVSPGHVEPLEHYIVLLVFNRPNEARLNGQSLTVAGVEPFQGTIGVLGFGVPG